MESQLEAKIAMPSAQMSLYLSEDPSAEGGADTTMRAFVEGGIQIRTEGWFFEISSREGQFRADEIMLSDATQAQNIFTGKAAELPPSMYFIPSGWKTYSHCQLAGKPTASLGMLEMEFFGEGREMECELADGSAACAKIGACMHARLAGKKASVIWGAREVESEEIYACASCEIGGAGKGAAVALKKPQGGLLLLQKKDKPSVEILAGMAGVKKPVDAQHPLVAKPESFGGEFSVFYFVPKEGRAKIELLDIFGLKRMDVIDENAAAGAYEIRVDGSRLPPGPYSINYMLGGKKLAQASAMKKFGGMLFK